jgi:histidinol-phosphate aminotransferase
MKPMLSPMLEQDFLSRGFTRRRLGRVAALLTGASTLPFCHEAVLAQQSAGGRLPPGAVKINANENPLGPCPEAMEAMYGAIRLGGRYQYYEADAFAEAFADAAGLPRDHVMPFAGSSDPLFRVVLAFCSPTRSLVAADTTYESPEGAARFIGAKVVRVPLTKQYAHDVRAMAEADPDAGVIYVCNPNNPTGTLTSRADIEYLVAHKPKGAIVLLDEAYIHFSDAPSCLDLAAAGKDLILTRTFSKIYGMAGLRAGAAVARPDLLAKLRPYGVNIMPATGMVGAAASLRSKNLVPERKRINREIREEVFRFLSKRGLRYTPSVSNKFLLEVGRPGVEFARAMAAENVFIGRVWPAMPTWVRISIGTPEEMKKFQTALVKVIG